MLKFWALKCSLVKQVGVVSIFVEYLRCLMLGTSGFCRIPCFGHIRTGHIKAVQETRWDSYQLKVLDIVYWISDIGYWMLDIGYRILGL